jgi:hypothetical protein
MLSILFYAGINAQTTVTFEALPLPTSNYWKGTAGVAGDTTFVDGITSFTNFNDTTGGGNFWSGWGYSATTDTIDPSYANEMSAIAGKGHNSSNVYGVAYVAYDAAYNQIKFSTPRFIQSMYITNTTLAFRSMQNGDAFAKKFGGTTGSDPDFFCLHITAWYQGNPVNDTVHFYLADFRDSNNANDYIIKNWTFVDLSTLGIVDSLTYSLSSSDTNSFGLNTPAYFCVDDINHVIEGIDEVEEKDGLKIYPVPMNEYMNIENTSNKNFKLTILSLNGQQVFSSYINLNETKKIITKQFSKGVYIMRFDDGEKVSYKKISK